MCRTVEEHYDWACRMARRWHRTEYEDNLSVLLEGLWVFDWKGLNGNPRAFAVSFAKRRRVDDARKSHARKRWADGPVSELPHPNLLPSDHRDFRDIDAAEEVDRAVARFPKAATIVEVMRRDSVTQTTAAETLGMSTFTASVWMAHLRDRNEDRARMLLGRKRGEP